jgi:glycosyltransferase involved in cell wall biosynthesis
MNNKNLVFFIPYIGGGGVEKNLFLISNYLSTKINNIYICTTSNKYKNKFNKKIKFILPKKKISENLYIRIKYFYCLIILFIFLLKNKNTVVFSFQANIYSILLCKILRIKIISRSNSSPSGWNHNFIKKIIYKKIINMADLIITNSKDFKKQMDKIFDIKSVCIYNPLNKIEIISKSKTKSDFNFFNNKKKELKIINIGRLTEQKDQLTLLKSAKVLNEKKINFKLLIMGRGVKKKNLLNYIDKNNLNKIVKIINFRENPFPILIKADLFILSSKYEGLPNVLLEAILLKKFIISSNCPTGPKEILLNGKGGFLFKVGDYEELSKKIIFYYKNSLLLRRKIKYSYKNLNRFDYKKNMDTYYRLVKKFLY